MSSQPSDSSDDNGAGDVGLTAAAGESELKGRTLPPPWGGISGPLSVTALTLEQQRPGLPIPRKKGPHAELATLEAQLRAADKQHDPEAERRAAMALSRALAARGSELDTATRLARRALVLGDDPSLRTELSTWFAGLGEPALAAATLRPMLNDRSGVALSRLLTRIAVLLARAGDAAGAARALREATEHADTDPLPPELLGAVGAWAPDSLPAESAALAYVEGSRRRERAGEKSAAFEDLLRAFEAAPQCAEAANALHHELTERGRAGAADEVLREHARALPDEPARAVHLARMELAAEQGELHRGIAAGLDARLESDFNARDAVLAAARLERGEQDSGFDGLLDEVGLHDLRAARLELAADGLEGAARAAARTAAARIYSAKLARPTRAVQGWLDAVVNHPAEHDAWKGLREHAAQTMDFAPLVEGLIRVTERATDSEAWGSSAEELLHLAEERLSDPGLAAWAARRLVAQQETHVEARQALERLAPRVRLQNETLRTAREQLARQPQDVQVLARVASVLLGRPDDVQATLPILAALVELAPGQARWRQQYRLLLERVGDFAKLEDFLDDLAAEAHSPEKEALVLDRARLARGRRDFERALLDLRPWLGDSNTHTEVSALGLVLASRVRDERARAQALVRVVAPLRPPLRATLLSIAVESLLAAGDVHEARTLAEAACHADPSRTRPVAARAFAVADAPQPDHAALERAVGVVVPRTTICAAIAKAYESEGSPLLALAWTQRQLALRPGDLAVAEVLLGRVIQAGDAARLSDALAWLLSQPEPLDRLATPISQALRTLAKLDPDRSAAIARRALDVLGPRKDDLREAILEVADAVGERGLGIAVIERWLASGAPGDLRGQVLLRVAVRRRDAGDADGAARTLGRALKEGVDAKAVQAELERFPSPRGSDGILALLEVRADVLTATVVEDPATVAEAWREVGAARWDLARDTAGAFEAWRHAARLDPEHGYSKLAADLLNFAGAEAALAELERLAEAHTDRAETARILSVAAGVALEAGRLRDALDIGARALGLDPSRTDVLAIVERSARPEDIALLDEVYERLAARSLGMYGTRAAHYRAARQMEQRKQLERAYAHALKAFEAVPTEGVAFVMLARLVQSLDNRAEFVRALERVAQESSDRYQRSRWLKRAAMFADDSMSGARQRLEVLLRALAVSPDLDTLTALGDAMQAVLRGAPEDREILELRYERALGSILKHASGYNGALLLVRGASIALNGLDAVRPAQQAVLSAIQCDPGSEAFSELSASVPVLAADRESAERVIQETLALAREEFSGVGASLLRFAGELAIELGRVPDAARLFVAAAERRPEDRSLVRTAERLAHEVGDHELLEQVLRAVPANERLAGLFEIAAHCRETGQLSQAIDALKRALNIEGLDKEAHAEVQERLAEAYRQAGHNTDLEALLSDRLQKDDLRPDVRVELSVELAALIGTGGDPERALQVLAPIARERQDRGLLGDMAALAEQAGDKRAQAEALDMMVDHEQDPADRLELLKRLGALLEELGDESAALARYREVLELNPNDLEALAAREREAEGRGDFEGLVEILARRATVAPLVDDVRRIQLHRAMVLEQRLARPEEARTELEALVAATGDNLSVLRVLADLNQRLGDPARAATLWLRASALARDRTEAADLAFKSCEAQLSAGDVGAARRVLEGIEGWSQNLHWRQLKVRVERLSEDPFALGHALEELALASDASPEERARLLVEAAQTALAAGDTKEAARRVKIAARFAPGDAEALLMKHSLGYRQSGVSDADQARLMVAELRGLEGELSDAQEELRGFLVAEALDRILGAGAGAGLTELENLIGRIGPRPLLALGLAERALAAQDHLRAQRFFERALTGDLQELRSAGEVALLAAETARALGNTELALAWAESAARDETLRARATALLDALHRQQADPAAEPPLERAAATRRSTPAATVADDEGWEIPEQQGPAEQPPAEVVHVPVTNARVPAVVEVPPLAGEVAVSEGAEQPPPPEVLEANGPDSSERLMQGPPVPEILDPLPSPLDDAEPDSSLAYADNLPPDSGRVVRPLSPGYEISGVIQSPFAEPAPDEADLLQRLQRGDEAAARELITRLEGRPERTQDLVSVCRRLSKLKPGDPWALRRLHDAISQDGNYAYASAVGHLIAACEGDGTAAEAAPPLRDQPELPEAVRAMLFRGAVAPGVEALRIVWEGASHVFRRDPSTYGVTGLERVPIGAPTTLARVYSEAARALGLTRTPMFQRRSAGSVTISLALLNPPSLILSGEVSQDTSALRYHVGSMLATAWPEHVLLFGAGEAPVKAVLRALLIAFGPPSTSHNPQSVANLAEVLWESIPMSGQRQLRQLCDEPSLLDYTTVVTTARRVQQRTGLFISGDFGLSLRQLLAQEQPRSEPPTSLEELAALAQRHSAVADLVKLASSPEYAEVRWQPAKSNR